MHHALFLPWSKCSWNCIEILISLRIFQIDSMKTTAEVDKVKINEWLALSRLTTVTGQWTMVRILNVNTLCILYFLSYCFCVACHKCEWMDVVWPNPRRTTVLCICPYKLKQDVLLPWCHLVIRTRDDDIWQFCNANLTSWRHVILCHVTIASENYFTLW